jgi:hypothetical protein
MELEFCRHIFKKSERIEFNEKPSSGSRNVTCGRTDMAKETGVFRSFANALKNYVKQPAEQKGSKPEDRNLSNRQNVQYSIAMSGEQKRS